MRIFPTARRALAAAIMISAAVPISAAADAFDNLTEELIELRSRVEELHADLADDKAQHKSLMNGLAMQKAELDAGIKRQELRIRQLEQTLDKNHAEARDAGVADERLKPVLYEAVAELRESIRRGLPFKTGERLGELETIESQLRTGDLPPAKAANRLWAFYQDELRLTSENGIYRQSIELDGEQMLADVARLGTVLMFFRTNDGRLGQVVREGDRWHYRVLDSSSAETRIAGLFDSLKKQIRTGWFELSGRFAVQPETVAANEEAAR